MRYLLCAIVLLVLSLAHAQLPTGGIVAFYPFNNDAIDKSPNNNHGQLIGGVSAAEDRFGNSCGALRFNGADGYINVSASASLKSPSNALSITAWFKIEKGKNLPGQVNLVLLSKSGTSDKAAAKAQYCFKLTHGFGEPSSNISMCGDASALDNNYNAHPIEPDQWYFLAVVYEENWINIFLNNKLIAQSIVKKPFVPNDLNLEIGREAMGTTQYFSGCLDDLRIYNRGLSPFEITALFNDQSGKEMSQGISMALPKNLEKVTEPGKCSAVVSFTEPVASGGCGKVELKQVKGLPGGSLFNAGKNLIAYEAGSSGKKLVDSFYIIVTDKEPPVLQCPADLEIKARGGELTKVEYAIPTASDNCPNVRLELVSGPASAEFPEGLTTVKYKAIDAAGNSSDCSFKVNVTKPVQRTLHCPKDVVAFTKGHAENILVHYDAPFIDLGGNKVDMKRVKGSSSGSLFRVGPNEVVYQSYDTAEKNFTCTFNVVVRDTIKPALVCPGDIYKTSEAGQKSMAVHYAFPQAIDGGSHISVKLIAGYMSDSSFPVGVTPVRFEAIDESGNKSECSFKVTIEEKAPVIAEKIKEPVAIPPPAPVAVKKEEKPKPEPVKENKPSTEEKIRAAEKVFLPPVSEQKEPTPKSVAVQEEIKEEKIKEAQKPFVNPLVEQKEKPKTEAKPLAAETTNTKEKKLEAEKIFLPIPPEEKPKEVVPVPSTLLIVAEEKKMVEAKADLPVAVKVKDTAPKKTSGPAKPLRISCAENVMKKTDAGKCGAVVDYLVPDIQGGNEPKLVQTKGLASGRFFKPGNTVNAFSASDASGYMKECTFNVTVRDEEPPVFKCPLDTIIHLPANRRGVIYYYKDPVVNDNCSVDSLIQVVGSKDGCFLQIGVHPFIFKAIDASGNYQMCTYSVIIKEDIAVVNTAPPVKLDETLSLGKDSVHYEYKAEVNDCVLTVFMYDDGEEDNDTVSIIFNGQVIVNRDMIRVKEHKMIKRIIVLDGGNENYIIAKAWNKGRYGLNTLRIDVYEGHIENDKRDLRDKKPVMSKVLHSKPGTAGGMILKCKE